MTYLILQMYYTRIEGNKWCLDFIRLTRRVPLVEQELLTIPEHLSSPAVFSGVRVTRSLVLCVCFVERCLSFSPFFFWPLCCLFFFDIRILVIPLVSSSSSYNRCERKWVTWKQLHAILLFIDINIHRYELIV